MVDMLCIIHDFYMFVVDTQLMVDLLHVMSTVLLVVSAVVP